MTPALDAVDLGSATRVIVLEGVNNPDNIGGIFRSAAAFNADLVALGPACADPLYRKSIRTSIGATLDVPYAQAEPWPQALDQLKRAGFRVIALTTAATRNTAAAAERRAMRALPCWPARRAPGCRTSRLPPRTSA